MLHGMFLEKEFVGQKFKEYRKKASLTQEELAEKVGIAEKHYGRLERGICLPALDTFFNLVKVLNIPLSDFGIETNSTQDIERENLIKEIFLSKPRELNALSGILKIIKDISQTVEEV